MYTYSFEKLNVWQQARQLTKEIYIVTNSFPVEEKFGLVSQMRRSSISVGSNIAEGSSRKTDKDQAHFYTTAFSSLVELLNQLILSYDLGFLPEEKYIELRNTVELISNQLNKLRKSTSTNS
ncbi:MAG: four helix bundle protein [Bacteroidales bacterium]|nr:four helix bundle protein [Bacteroidales bacterium]